MNTETRLIVLDHHFFVTERLEEILKKHNIKFKSVGINDLFINIDKICRDILLLPASVFKIIDHIANAFLQNCSHLQRVIIVSNEMDDKWRVGSNFGSLHVSDFIHIRYSDEIILSILHKHL